MKTLSEHHRDIQLELEAAAAATAVWRIQRRQKQNSRQHTHHHFSLSESPSMPGFGGWPLTVATPLTAAPFEWNCCCCCCCCCWACCWACCTWNNNFVHSAFNNTSLGVILRDLFPNQRSLYTWRYLQYIIPPPFLMHLSTKCTFSALPTQTIQLWHLLMDGCPVSHFNKQKFFVIVIKSTLTWGDEVMKMKRVSPIIQCHWDWMGNISFNNKFLTLFHSTS